VERKFARYLTSEEASRNHCLDTAVPARENSTIVTVRIQRLQ